ncbi:histone-lysine N-methyltransferase setd3-like protein [Leptotrombidium deliense]|uniref:protein-histidine N-methyltransferase n=1 Tax=Leptotrombidium deliense TaxID=299467 RepID=A0A443SSG8_9ACAR|nr:histone-lysine N-methyltransferase setd3-like protein [Leptotrombidium deliense]
MAKARKNKTHNLKRIQCLVDELLDKCLHFATNEKPTNSVSSILDEHRQLYEIIERLIELEKDVGTALPDREAHFDSFIDWCKNNGIDCSNIEVFKCDGDNEYGLKTRVDINENDLLLVIPRKLILSTETAFNDNCYATFAKVDPILQSMPNVLLSMHIIEEYCKGDSFWKPYLSICPSHYSTPLYYTHEQMKLLKGSTALQEAVKLCRNIFRQYAYFWKQLHTPSSAASKLSMKNVFTFNLYRWGISTAMTRQNFVPSTDGSTMINALIPLWDLCNHKSGKQSTDYCNERGAIVCYAMQHFSSGDQITIFYGNRSNAEFLIHNGFVADDNENDFIYINLGISKNDPLFALKSQLCKQVNVPVADKFILKAKNRAMDKNLLAFLRIFHMNQNELESLIDNSDQLFATESEKYKHLQNRIDLFMSTRCDLLITSYDNPNNVLQTQISGNIIKLISFEKNILESYVLK